MKGNKGDETIYSSTAETTISNKIRFFQQKEYKEKEQTIQKKI